MVEHIILDNETADLQTIAENHLEQVKEFYLKDPSLLLEQYELERKASEEYDGRQLLELIQNADDAAKTARIRKGLVHLKNDKLIIANTGEPFTKGGLDSILHSNLSPKFNEINQIGNKGLGFRAILSWAKRIAIKSGFLNISFSKEHSVKVLNELIEKRPLIKDNILQRYKKYEQAIAILRCPEIINDLSLPEIYNEYDTVIILELKENAIAEVEKQIFNTVDTEMMLFLNHLDHLEILTPSLRQSMHREILLEEKETKNRTIKRISISVTKDEVAYVNEWNIYSVNGTREGDAVKGREAKNYVLSVAWQDSLKESKNLLHSYFRTDVQFKFPGILHGTFELSSNRNELIKGSEGHNAFLFSEASKLIADTAERISKNSEEPCSYKAMHLAMVDFNSLCTLIKDLGFESLLKDEIKKRKIFPTINNKYIDWGQKPVYFKEAEFAELLDPKKFPHLLLCCDTDNEEYFLQSLIPFIYNTDDIIKTVLEKRKQILLLNYARLIGVIHSHIIEGIKLEDLPSLFFDEHFNVITFQKPIFLPSKEAKYSLPVEVGVQIIHPLLVEHLVSILEVSNSSSLIPKLSKFQLKEFKFSEIAEALIKHYYLDENTNHSAIKELHKHLFDLYKKEGSSEFIWQGFPIPFINKAGEIKSADRLYFGKEYGNKLVEELYSYDKSKLIAGPKQYSLIETEVDNWIKYLGWAGLVNIPRKVEEQGSYSYAEYCMKNFDYKTKIDNYIFKNYVEFKRELTGGYGSITVTSIDDIDKLLVNNKSDAILEWINSDEKLLKELEGDIEPQSSNINFWFYNTRTSRISYGQKMKNYIRWKLAHTPWLKTESGVIQSPYLCTTAGTITSEFSPLIEKPSLDLDNLRIRGINKDKVEYLLSLIGVHKSINTLSTNTLFSILLKLPEIDAEGKKAKVIYNQLATNYEEKLLDKIDKMDDNYIQFQNNGKVFTRKGKTSSYISIKDSYYVNDKRFGESIINQFNTIYIDRRRGKAKIKSLFGVTALDNIKLRIVQEQLTPHPLNLDFELEIEHFKPYVYVLRQEVDNGTERNTIKDARFMLVTELVVDMLQDNGEETFTLEPYEFFYLKPRNTVYVKTPIYLDEIKKLKADVLFCSVIAEAFSALLDVETQRPQIRELFSNSISGRNEIIRTELDDTNLEKLLEAKSKLGITTDPKIGFWTSFLKCFPAKRIIIDNMADKDLREMLVHSFPDLSAIINNVFDEINYNEINEEQSSLLIVKLFSAAKITITKFNHFHFPSINIQELYEISFRRLKEGEKGKFNTLYYERCLREDNLKENYLSVISSFSNISATVVNEVGFDIGYDLYKKIEEKYLVNLTNLPIIINPDSIYLLNKQQLILKGKEAGIDTLLVDQFLNENIKAQSLLFFNDRSNEIFDTLNKWVFNSDNSDNSKGVLSKSKRITYGSEAIFFDDFVDLKEQLDSIIFKEGIEGIETIPIKIEKTDEKARGGNGKPGNSGGRKPFKPKEDIAFLGEYLVYRHLLNTMDKKESVKWVSEYARKCDENLEGIDGLGYDLQYIPNGSIYPRYVEVKVVGWEDSFHISSNEVKVGEKLKKNFEIFLVRNIETPSKITIERISGLFDYKGKSFTDNALFTVVNDNFILKFKKIT